MEDTQKTTEEIKETQVTLRRNYQERIDEHLQEANEIQHQIIENHGRLKLLSEASEKAGYDISGFQEAIKETQEVYREFVKAVNEKAYSYNKLYLNIF